MGTFIPERLKKAREDMGLTQEAFGRSLGLSSEFISLLESGKRAPSLDTLARIAAAVHRDPSFFLSEKEHVFTLLFRAASLDDQVRTELEHFRSCVDEYLRLEDETGRRLDLAPLYAGVTPERLAAEERRRLGLGEEPVRDIFALFERNGCRVLRRRMPPGVQLSGVFVFLEAREAAFALINATQTLCRQIFTAAHEYCHYLKDRHDFPVLDRQDIFGDAPLAITTPGGPALDKKERFAQEFAAHFLMPPTKVREFVEKEFGSERLSYDDILLVKRYFCVSAQAMLRTLRDLGLISAALFEDYQGRDPAGRELEVFGDSAEECWPAGQAASPVLSQESGGGGQSAPDVIVSDRHKFLKQLSVKKQA